MPNTIQLSFEELSTDQREILIAHLAELGFEGFEETDSGLNAYISENNFDRTVVAYTCSKYGLDFEENVLPAQNWNHSWESNFQPVIVDDFVAVRADFHPAINNVKYELLITPKMSFGTGHHATTYMMMQQMREIDFKDRSVLDLGTGTGVLAILAEKLGASSVLAIDNDEWSISNAEENICKNHCSKIDLRLSDSLAEMDHFFDIILANINRNVILDNLASLVKHMQKATELLLSGLLTSDEEDLLEAARKFSLNPCRRMENNNWICLSLTC
jgi:ribosomal protein L11 methyltransferase